MYDQLLSRAHEFLLMALDAIEDDGKSVDQVIDYASSAVSVLEAAEAIRVNMEEQEAR